MEAGTNHVSAAELGLPRTEVEPSRSVSIIWGREIGIIYENYATGAKGAYVYRVEYVILTFVVAAVFFWKLLARRRKL